MFNIVLVEPQIPPNTGNIGRLCVNLGATLHLVKPLGFDISQKSVRRAGLDYWSKLELKIWESLEEFLEANKINKHFHLATTKTDNIYWDAKFRKGDFILFGSETKGLDKELLTKYPQNCIKIPMSEDGRSLNLSVSVGVVAYEALRQCWEA
jgi:tRNA (cytidine/uridine-2'-O-)-methyltransferase